MRCPRCGTENPPGKILCRQCGTRLRAQPQGALLIRETDAKLMERVRLDARRIVYVTAVVVAAGLLMGYLTR